MFRFQSYSKHNSKHYDIFPICVTYTCHLPLLRKLKKQFHRLLLHIFNMKWAIGFRIVKGIMQKQPPRGVLWKSYSENMQQIYRRTTIRNVISIKLFCNFIGITLLHGCCPVNLLHIFRTPFPKNTSGWLLLIAVISILQIYDTEFDWSFL